MKGPSRINIEINKQIMRDGVRALCTLIETRVGEFNHVNVATAFRKLLPLQDRRDGASRGEVEQALRSLELSALQNIEDFGSQQIANTLHAMANSCALKLPTTASARPSRAAKTLRSERR